MSAPLHCRCAFASHFLTRSSAWLVAAAILIVFSTLTITPEVSSTANRSGSLTKNRDHSESEIRGTTVDGSIVLKIVDFDPEAEGIEDDEDNLEGDDDKYLSIGMIAGSMTNASGVRRDTTARRRTRQLGRQYELFARHALLKFYDNKRLLRTLKTSLGGRSLFRSFSRAEDSSLPKTARCVTQAATSSTPCDKEKHAGGDFRLLSESLLRHQQQESTEKEEASIRETEAIINYYLRRRYLWGVDTEEEKEEDLRAPHVSSSSSASSVNLPQVLIGSLTNDDANDMDYVDKGESIRSSSSSDTVGANRPIPLPPTSHSFRVYGVGHGVSQQQDLNQIFFASVLSKPTSQPTCFDSEWARSGRGEGGSGSGGRSNAKESTSISCAFSLSSFDSFPDRLCSSTQHHYHNDENPQHKKIPTMLAPSLKSLSPLFIETARSVYSTIRFNADVSKLLITVSEEKSRIGGVGNDILEEKTDESIFLSEGKQSEGGERVSGESDTRIKEGGGERNGAFVIYNSPIVSPLRLPNTDPLYFRMPPAEENRTTALQRGPTWEDHHVTALTYRVLRRTPYVNDRDDLGEYSLPIDSSSSDASATATMSFVDRNLSSSSSSWTSLPVATRRGAALLFTKDEKSRKGVDITAADSSRKESSGKCTSEKNALAAARKSLLLRKLQLNNGLLATPPSVLLEAPLGVIALFPHASLNAEAMHAMLRDPRGTFMPVESQEDEAASESSFQSGTHRSFFPPRLPRPRRRQALRVAVQAVVSMVGRGRQVTKSIRSIREHLLDVHHCLVFATAYAPPRSAASTLSTSSLSQATRSSSPEETCSAHHTANLREGLSIYEESPANTFFGGLEDLSLAFGNSLASVYLMDEEAFLTFILRFKRGATPSEIGTTELSQSKSGEVTNGDKSVVTVFPSFLKVLEENEKFSTSSSGGPIERANRGHRITVGGKKGGDDAAAGGESSASRQVVLSRSDARFAVVARTEMAALLMRATLRDEIERYLYSQNNKKASSYSLVNNDKNDDDLEVDEKGHTKADGSTFDDSYFYFLKRLFRLSRSRFPWYSGTHTVKRGYPYRGADGSLSVTGSEVEPNTAPASSRAFPSSLLTPPFPSHEVDRVELIGSRETLQLEKGVHTVRNILIDYPRLALWRVEEANNRQRIRSMLKQYQSERGGRRRKEGSIEEEDNEETETETSVLKKSMSPPPLPSLPRLPRALIFQPTTAVVPNAPATRLGAFALSLGLEGGDYYYNANSKNERDTDEVEENLAEEELSKTKLQPKKATAGRTAATTKKTVARLFRTKPILTAAQLRDFFTSYRPFWGMRLDVVVRIRVDVIMPFPMTLHVEASAAPLVPVEEEGSPADRKGTQTPTSTESKNAEVTASLPQNEESGGVERHKYQFMYSHLTERFPLQSHQTEPGPLNSLTPSFSDAIIRPVPVVVFRVHTSCHPDHADRTGRNTLLLQDRTVRHQFASTRHDAFHYTPEDPDGLFARLRTVKKSSKMKNQLCALTTSPFTASSDIEERASAADHTHQYPGGPECPAFPTHFNETEAFSNTSSPHYNLRGSVVHEHRATHHQIIRPPHHPLYAYYPHPVSDYGYVALDGLFLDNAASMFENIVVSDYYQRAEIVAKQARQRLRALLSGKNRLEERKVKGASSEREGREEEDTFYVSETLSEGFPTVGGLGLEGMRKVVENRTRGGEEAKAKNVRAPTTHLFLDLAVAAGMVVERGGSEWFYDEAVALAGRQWALIPQPPPLHVFYSSIFHRKDDVSDASQYRDNRRFTPLTPRPFYMAINSHDERFDGNRLSPRTSLLAFALSSSASGGDTKGNQRGFSLNISEAFAFSESSIREAPSSSWSHQASSWSSTRLFPAKVSHGVPTGAVIAFLPNQPSKRERGQAPSSPSPLRAPFRFVYPPPSILLPINHTHQITLHRGGEASSSSFTASRPPPPLQEVNAVGTTNNSKKGDANYAALTSIDDAFAFFGNDDAQHSLLVTNGNHKLYFKSPVTGAPTQEAIQEVEAAARTGTGSGGANDGGISVPSFGWCLIIRSDEAGAVAMLKKLRFAWRERHRGIAQWNTHIHPKDAVAFVAKDTQAIPRSSSSTSLLLLLRNISNISRTEEATTCDRTSMKKRLLRGGVNTGEKIFRAREFWAAEKNSRVVAAEANLSTAGGTVINSNEKNGGSRANLALPQRSATTRAKGSEATEDPPFYLFDPQYTPFAPAFGTDSGGGFAFIHPKGPRSVSDYNRFMFASLDAEQSLWWQSAADAESLYFTCQPHSMTRQKMWSGVCSGASSLL